MLRKSNAEEVICQKMLEYMEIQPFIKMKVTEFTKFANISRTSFYSHFDSLSDVVQKLEDDLMNELDDENSMDLSEIKTGKSPKLIRAVEFISENLDAYRLLAGENGDPYFQVRLANRSARIMHTLVQNIPTTLTDSQLKMVVENISGGRWQMYLWWTNHANEITAAEVVELTEKMIKPIFAMIAS